MFGFTRKKLELPTPEEALPGRVHPIPTTSKHFVNGNPIKGLYPEGFEVAYFALGCYWGAERRFWQVPGVWVTAVGNIAGLTPNPTYEEVCSGMTGHNEVVRVVFDPAVISYTALLKSFWEGHDPTQGMRQGNDVGTQYRSGIYTFDDDQWSQANASRDHYQHALSQATHAPITSEILPAPFFYFAEGYHQQYLAKNPAGYCGLGGTGVAYPMA